MAILETVRPITFGTRFATRLTAAVSAVVLRINEWNSARATRRALNSLSDLHLEDIGITRADIDSITR